MDRFSLSNEIGSGSFGNVFLAVHKSTGQKRAVKRLKGPFQWDELIPLREVQSLMEIAQHPNIVRLFEVHRTSDSTVYFVFEYMSAGSLHDLILHTSRSSTVHPGTATIPEEDIRLYVSQVLAGLQHLHSQRYMHRDIKPENLLLEGKVCKIADFSLARRFYSRGQNQEQTFRQNPSSSHLPSILDCPLTSYVSTRWYRAPEVLLGSTHYDSSVDIFALGCIVAELYTLEPLFPGSSEVDQLHRILHFASDRERLTGPWLRQTWPEGADLLVSRGVSLPPTLDCVGQGATMEKKCPSDRQGPVDPTTRVVDSSLRINIRSFFKKFRALNTLDGEVVRLMEGLLCLNPEHRLTAQLASLHPYFGSDTLSRQEFKSTESVGVSPQPTIQTSLHATVASPKKHNAEHPLMEAFLPNSNGMDTGKQPSECLEDMSLSGQATIRRHAAVTVSPKGLRLQRPGTHPNYPLSSTTAVALSCTEIQPNPQKLTKMVPPADVTSVGLSGTGTAAATTTKTRARNQVNATLSPFYDESSSSSSKSSSSSSASSTSSSFDNEDSSDDSYSADENKPSTITKNEGPGSSKIALLGNKAKSHFLGEKDPLGPTTSRNSNNVDSRILQVSTKVVNPYRRTDRIVPQPVRKEIKYTRSDIQQDSPSSSSNSSDSSIVTPKVLMNPYRKVTNQSRSVQADSIVKKVLDRYPQVASDSSSESSLSAFIAVPQSLIRNPPPLHEKKKRVLPLFKRNESP